MARRAKKVSTEGGRAHSRTNGGPKVGTADGQDRIASLRAYAAHEEQDGVFLVGDSAQLLKSPELSPIHGKVRLILTSPPYPLNAKKSYGNLVGEAYKSWLVSLVPTFERLLADDGSLVIEIGNAWEPNRPVQSLLHLETLIALTKARGSSLRLIQQFACYNPSRLPSPAQWVTVQKIRTVDSFTHVWWLSKTDNPKADVSRVLRPYSEAMRSLIKRKRYNNGKRPSHHNVSETGFLKDNGGAIAHNFFELDALDAHRQPRLPNAFAFANTASSDQFTKTCKAAGLAPHPARMPMGLAAFFIEFLTDPGDIVVDPFAGSNTTGYAASMLGRRWLSLDVQDDYAHQSKLRFSARR